MKRITRISFMVVILAGAIVSAILLLRCFGPPWTGHVHKFFGARTGRFIQAAIGIADVQWYGDVDRKGHVQYREVYRGPFVITNSCIPLPRLFRGDYYNPEGRLVAEVRDGAGISILFHSNGIPRSLGFYANGVRNGPMVSWYSNGIIKGFYLYQSGQVHGAHYDWYEKGNIRTSSSYDRGLMKESRMWYESGVVKEHQYRDEKNARVIETYSTNGDLVERQMF